MIIVSGHLNVAPGEREAYLATCREVVRLARATDGCLDFALSPDLLEPGRVNVLERWRGAEELRAFRGAGVGTEQATMLLDVAVEEHEVP